MKKILAITSILCVMTAAVGCTKTEVEPVETEVTTSIEEVVTMEETTEVTTEETTVEETTEDTTVEETTVEETIAE